jgi:hypothetical protein
VTPLILPQDSLPGSPRGPHRDTLPASPRGPLRSNPRRNHHDSQVYSQAPPQQFPRPNSPRNNQQGSHRGSQQGSRRGSLLVSRRRGHPRAPRHHPLWRRDLEGVEGQEGLEGWPALPLSSPR